MLKTVLESALRLVLLIAGLNEMTAPRKGEWRLRPAAPGRTIE